MRVCVCVLAGINIKAENTIFDHRFLCQVVTKVWLTIGAVGYSTEEVTLVSACLNMVARDRVDV